MPRTKRYIAFAGDSYYPAGGWRDFKGSAKTEQEAKDLVANQGFDWYHVIDTKTGEVFDQPDGD